MSALPSKTLPSKKLAKAKLNGLNLKGVRQWVFLLAILKSGTTVAMGILAALQFDIRANSLCGCVKGVMMLLLLVMMMRQRKVESWVCCPSVYRARSAD